MPRTSGKPANSYGPLPQQLVNNKCQLTLIVVLLLATLAQAYAQSARTQTGQYKTLHTFRPTHDGNNPVSSLIADANGALYGTTVQGGTHGSGTVFRLLPRSDGAWKEEVLYNFCSVYHCADGWQPWAGVVFDSSGNLYGTTVGGGSGSQNNCGYLTCGVVFKLSREQNGNWKESVIHNFTGTPDGSEPVSELTFDPAGNLYGTAYNGGTGAPGLGVVFRLTPRADGTWKESVVYRFTGSGDGAYSYSYLVLDKSGNLYGTTPWGTNYGYGTVFKLVHRSHDNWKLHVLHTFTGDKDGASPWTGVTLDRTGALYGTTRFGGLRNCSQQPPGCGVVFTLVNSGGHWKERVLHTFAGGPDGSDPWKAPAMLDASGNLYGTTSGGGAYQFGTVFKLTAETGGDWKKAVLHDFRDHPGALPPAGVILDSLGDIFGTTYGDGSETLGSVYEITP